MYFLKEKNESKIKNGKTLKVLNRVKITFFSTNTTKVSKIFLCNFRSINIYN